LVSGKKGWKIFSRYENKFRENSSEFGGRWIGGRRGVKGSEGRKGRTIECINVLP
jgi:hypothetical protein